MDEDERIDGFRSLRAFHKSPDLVILSAKHTAQQELNELLQSSDDDVNDYIVGMYAASNTVKLPLRSAKYRLSSAMTKLKGKLIMSKLLAGTKKAQTQEEELYVAKNIAPEDLSKVASILADLGKWSFDVWDLVPLTNNNPLVVTGVELFKRWEIGSSLNLKATEVYNFFTALESAYVKENTYHNNVHAADVMYTMSCFIEYGDEFRKELEAKDLLASLVAAAAHDVNHDGSNNAYHVLSQSDLAIRYNDTSVLESMHCAELFMLCKNQTINIFKTLAVEEYREVRNLILKAILGTDMGHHFNHMSDFRSKLDIERAIAINPFLAETTSADQRMMKVDMVVMVSLFLSALSFSSIRPLFTHSRFLLLLIFVSLYIAPTYLIL
jgi:hypothetical protein